jgi:hypothetical protein
MAIKVNLKKYLKLGERWQFVPVLRVNGIPKPAYVVINKEAVKEAAGEFYLDWRNDGKRHQVPCGSSPKDALDAWVGVVLADGGVDAAELGVDGFYGADGGFELAGVADHVGVGEVDDDDVEGGVGEGADDGVGGHFGGEVVSVRSA